MRMQRHCENALKVAQYLNQSDKILSVRYPGLKGDHYYDLAKKYMPNGTSGVVAFRVKGGRDAAAKLMDKTKLTSRVIHVADVRTCILHPASTTHRQMTDEQLKEAGIEPDLIRLSVGIEYIGDIIADLEQALRQL